jgi:hypothetical protein
MRLIEFAEQSPDYIQMLEDYFEHMKVELVKKALRGGLPTESTLGQERNQRIGEIFRNEINKVKKVLDAAKALKTEKHRQRESRKMMRKVVQDWRRNYKKFSPAAMPRSKTWSRNRWKEFHQDWPTNSAKSMVYPELLKSIRVFSPNFRLETFNSNPVVKS